MSAEWAGRDDQTILLTFIGTSGTARVKLIRQINDAVRCSPGHRCSLANHREIFHLFLAMFYYFSGSTYDTNLMSFGSLTLTVSA